MAIKIWFFILGIPKSILFNFYYFPFSTAIKLPVLVSHRVRLKKLSGNVNLGQIKTGIVKIGFGEVGIFDDVRSRAVWQVTGSVYFKGKARIGHGSKLSVSGNLVIGKNFCISAESSIIASKQVNIGDDVLLSWDVLIMDTDFHKIMDESGSIINEPKAVIIGDKVWFGCRSLVLKGVEIPNGVVVAASSTVGRSVEDSCSIVAGIPAKIVKRNISWED